MTVLSLDKEHEGRTFGLSGVYSPDAKRSYGTSNIPHPLAGIMGQTLSAKAEEGILKGLELLKAELGEWKAENLCFGYSIIFFDKSELE